MEEAKMMIPRKVLFKKELAVGVYPMIVNHDDSAIMDLPTDHYDFVGFDYYGKTKEQIEQELCVYLGTNQN
jgi:hypothetical protein